MRRIRILILLVAAAGSITFFASCSKKSSTPTAPVSPEPACSLSATSLVFGAVTVGTSSARQFTLTTSGTGTLSGTVADTCAQFALMGPATYNLGPGQSAT